MTFMALAFWWLAILWTYTETFPRPFDDWKNMVFYVGAGIWATAYLIKRTKCKLPLTPTPNRGDAPTGLFALSLWERGLPLTYFALALLSLTFAPTAQYEGVLELSRLVLWLGVAWAFSTCDARTWMGLMRITVISAALMAILSWLMTQGVSIWPYGAPFLAPIGHITYYSDFMALSWVMALGIWGYYTTLNTRPFSSPLLWLLCLFCIDIGLAVSATRASLVGCFAAVGVGIPLVYYVTRSFKTMMIVGAIAVLNLAIVLGVPVRSEHEHTAARDRLAKSLNIATVGIEAASGGRWHTYIASAHLIRERPLLGWGLGSFRFVYPEVAHRSGSDIHVNTQTWYYHPHNEILHQAVEVGGLGAVIWIIGMGYLLYRGIRALRHTGPDPASQSGPESKLLLLTAICGWVAALVSWQFSTNYLFPVSRLMTALLAGIIMSFIPHALPLRGRMAPHSMRGQERGKCTWAMITIVSLSTFFILAYQASLFCVQRQQGATSLHQKWHWATCAVRLAPGAFDPLYVQSTTAMQTMSPGAAAPYVETLYRNYPYVPVVLYMTGVLRIQQGNIPEARNLLQHALANDPTNTAAKQLLDQLPPAH